MGTVPHDAQVMQSILKDMGVVEFEPRVISQMLEFAYKYTTEIIEDARSISEHSGKKQIDQFDVQFALDNSAVSWKGVCPNRQLLIDLAEQKNSIALPPIRQNYGLHLPNDRFCLLQPNMQWKSDDRTREADIKTKPTVTIDRSQLERSNIRSEAITNVLKRKAPVDDDDYDIP